MTEKVLKAVDFFCGAGGMTYGLSQAGIDVLAGIDIDINCKETYELNNPNSKFIHADIHNLSVKDISRMIGIKKNDNSLIFIGCSPCQYWTKINTNKEKSEKSKNLLEDFQRFISHFKPGYIIVENVPGLYNKKDKNALSPFLKFLKKNGYSYNHGLINANHYGVPQHRIRYLLLSTRLTDDIILPQREYDDTLIVRNFIGIENGFPTVEPGHKDKTDFRHTVASLSEKNKKRIEITPPNGGTRESWKDVPELQIDAYHGNDNIFKDVYGRMYWDKPAPTITTKFNSLSNGRFGHPDEDRAISLREGATLQTFPKPYIFTKDNMAVTARHIGNAVPPELAKRIGTTIIEANAKFEVPKFGPI